MRPAAPAPVRGLAVARAAPAITLAVLVGPLVFGLAGTLLPAFGYLPALGGHRLTLAHFAAVLSAPGIGTSILLSLWSGLATTAISLAIVLAFVAGWGETRAFARLQHAISPLLAIPHAAAAFGLAFLIAPSGLLVRLASPWATGWERPPDALVVNDPMGLAMTAGLVLKEVPFLFLVTLAAMPQVPVRRIRRLTASLGYGRMAGFVFAAWPQIYAQIRLAVYAVIAYASSVVDVAVILGPGLPATLPVRLLQWMSDPDLAMRFQASAGAVLQLVVTGLALGLWWGMERLAGGLSRVLCARGSRLRRDGALRAAGLAAMALTAGTVFAGIAVLALWSMAGLWQFPDALPAEFSLRSWQRALPRLTVPFAVTVAVGLAATAIALALAVGCLEREFETGRGRGRRALLAIYLPLIVPQISFVFGLQILIILMGLDATIWALTLAHLIFVLPYVFLSLSDPWRAFDRRYDVIAAGLGQSRGRALWRVRLPMLTRAALTAAAVGFAVSVGQYLPTVLIGAGRLPTVTTEAVALAAGGNRRVIGVYAFVQTLLPFLAFAIASAVPALLFRNRRDMRI